MPSLTIRGHDRALQADLHRSILDVVMDNAVPISTSCGGVAACGQCRVTVRAGAALLSVANERELHHLGSATVATGVRLACQARFVADGVVEIDIPPVATVDQRQEKFTRMMRARRTEVAARGRRPSRGQERERPAEGKSNPTPGALQEERPRPGRRRRRRRR